MFILTIFLILILIFVCSVFLFSMSDCDKFCDYVIVLGARILDESRPCRALENRLICAIDYLNKFPKSKIIVTGGQGIDEVTTEASVMKKYLIKHGIDINRILVEDKSRNTFENLRNSREIIGDIGKIMIISSNYHLFRAMMIAHRVGFKKVYLKGSKDKSKFLKINVLREFFAIVKSFFTDW